MTRVQIVELPSHPFFIGVQFHPEFKSRPGKPSPPFLGILFRLIIYLLLFKFLYWYFPHKSDRHLWIRLFVQSFQGQTIINYIIVFQIALDFLLQSWQFSSTSMVIVDDPYIRAELEHFWCISWDYPLSEGIHLVCLSSKITRKVEVPSLIVFCLFIFNLF